MIAFDVKQDITATGRARRFIIGKPGEPISGAIYIDENVPIPDGIILGFPKGIVEDKGEDDISRS